MKEKTREEKVKSQTEVSKFIEEITSCDSNSRAKDTRDYESMLMDYIRGEFQ